MKYSYVFLFLIFFSCFSKGIEVAENNPLKSDLILMDTISLDLPYFIYASHFDEKLLGYNPWNNDVVLFNLENNSVSTFNKFGSGPEDYLLLFHNVGFNEKGDIIIGAVNGYKTYGQDGKFLTNYTLDRKSTFAPILKPFGKGKDIIGINLPQGRSSNPEFFQNRQEYLIKLNTDNQSLESIPGFQFKKLNNHEGYYLNNGLVVSAIEKNRIYLMDKNENKLRVFNFESEKEEKTIQLNLKYFEPHLIPFGKEFTQQQLKLLGSMNSTIMGIFVHNNRIFVVYDLAYSEEEISDLYKRANEIGENYSPPIKYVLHVSDVLGNPIIDDIIIPQEYGRPVFAGEDYILSMKEGNETNLLLKFKISGL
ncbi:hypothetical protein [Aquiflexum sp.]|uniref:hypothetical protein n=1 Tax=Aquiflexum sp. TaxID=1872584 RepID=UPI00359402EC